MKKFWLSLISIGLTGLNLLKRIKPTWFFMAFAITSQVAYTCLRPPFQSPDEFYHFCRAYQVSEGNFLPVAADQRVGGDLPLCLKEYYSLYMPITITPQLKTKTSAFLNPSGIICSGNERVFIDFPNTSTYSPLAYLPQSLTLFVLRSLNFSMELQYYLSKIFAFILYLVCMLFVIKTLPVYKWLFTLMLLLPMNLYMINSYTGDTMTNLLAFMLIALILKNMFALETISKKDIAIILFIGILLAFTKVIYVSLMLLLVMIPSVKFSSKGSKIAIVTVLIIIPFLTANTWSRRVMENYPIYEEYNVNYRQHCTIMETANHKKQLEHLKNNKSDIFKVLYSSITSEPEFYLRSYVGHFGTYMDTPIPKWVYKTALILLVLVALFEKNAFSFTWKNKLVMIVTAFGAYSLIIFSLHLMWNDVGSVSFPKFQGRYLMPLFPLLFMSLNLPWQNIKRSPTVLVSLFVLISNAVALNLLYQRYFKDVYLSRMEIHCDVENINTNGNIETTDKNVNLKPGGQVSRIEKRSGANSLVVKSDTVKAFEYHFSDLKQSDMVEITGWYKGSGAQIGISGFGKNCNPFTYINEEMRMKDKAGWNKLLMIFFLPQSCDSNKMSLFFKKKGKDPVYFDDINYRITKFE